MAKTLTLLEKAQQYNTGSNRMNFGEEQRELAKSWIRGELRTKAYQQVMQFKSPGQVYNHVASCLKEMYRNNGISFTK